VSAAVPRTRRGQAQGPLSYCDQWFFDLDGSGRIGLSLADLEKLNRKPFKLRGFDSDKTATVSDWDHGALAALPGGCKAGVILSAEAKAAAQVLAVLPVDREFSSADEALRAVRPSVTEILIGY
jgi:hypothetical protein